MSRTRKATWNLASSLVYTAVLLAVSLISTPMLLHWLKEDRLGAVRTATDLFGWLTLLELGLGGTLSPLLARALAHDDRHALHQTMAAGTRAYLLLTLPVLAVGLALAWGLDNLIPIGEDDPIPVRMALRADLHRAWFIGLAGWMALCLVPMRALLEAGQRGYRVNLLLTAQGVLVVAASLALAYAGWGITGQMIATAGGSLLLALALTFDASRAHPGLLRATWATRPDRETRAAIWTLGWPTLLCNLSGRLAVLSDSIIISAILRDPKLALHLVFLQRLAQLAQAQLQGIGNASWAALAELNARGEREQFNRRLVDLTGLVSILGMTVLAPIVAFNADFLRIWLKANAPADPYLVPVVVVAAANALMTSVFSLWTWCYSGTGNIRRIVLPAAVTAVTNLVLSLVLTKTLGLIGPILGTLIAQTVVPVGMILPRMHRDFGVSVAALCRAVAVPAAWGVPYAFALSWLARAYPPDSWLALAALMSASALVYLLLAGRFLLSPTDREAWLARLSSIVGRR